MSSLRLCSQSIGIVDVDVVCVCLGSIQFHCLADAQNKTEKKNKFRIEMNYRKNSKISQCVRCLSWALNGALYAVAVLLNLIKREAIGFGANGWMTRLRPNGPSYVSISNVIEYDGDNVDADVDADKLHAVVHSR